MYTVLLTVVGVAVMKDFFGLYAFFFKQSIFPKVKQRSQRQRGTQTELPTDQQATQHQTETAMVSDDLYEEAGVQPITQDRDPQ